MVYGFTFLDPAHNVHVLTKKMVTRSIKKYQIVRISESQTVHKTVISIHYQPTRQEKIARPVLLKNNL
jgi:ribosomal protein L2